MTLPLTPTSPFTDDQSVVTAATLNAWRTAINQALDGVAGGAYTPTSKIQIGGTGLEITATAGAAKSVQLASRARTIVQDIRHVQPESYLQWDFVLGVWRNLVDPEAPLYQPLDLPNGQVLNTVTVQYIGSNGGGGHGALPNPMPSLQIFKVDVNGVATALAAATPDGSGTVGAYEALHPITTGALAHTIDRATYSYHATVKSEGVTNYIANAELRGCSAAITITSLAEF